MAKTKFTNKQPGARGIRGTDGVLVMIEPGQSATVDVSDAELKDAKASKFFAIGGQADANAGDGDGEPGPLDQSIANLEAHLEGIDDADELRALREGEVAGKSRAGALAAIDARLEALGSAND